MQSVQMVEVVGVAIPRGKQLGRLVAANSLSSILVKPDFVVAQS
jgi:hypothetical protein